MHSFQSLTAKLYLFSFFDDFILIYPLYSVMFADDALNATQISTLLIVWSFTAFALEIPSGSIADKYPRKYVLLIGSLLQVAGYGFWLFMPTFIGFLVGFVLWCSIASIIIAACAVVTIPQTKAVQDTTETAYLTYFREGVANVLRQPLVLYLVLITGIIAGLGAIDEYFSLFLKQKDYSNTGLSLWFAVIYAMGAAGSLMAHRLEGRKPPLKLFLFMWAGLLWLSTIVAHWLAPVLLGLYLLAFSAAQVLLNAYLQRQLSDKTRATTTSVGGFTSELFAMVSFAIVGYGASKSDYSYSFELIAACVIFAGLILSVYAKLRHIKLA